MNDLETLKDAWGDPSPPSMDAYRSARAALMQEIAQGGAPRVAQRPPRRRGLRVGWLVGAATAAALAAVVAFAVIPGTSPSGPTGESSGRDLLLAAAVVAESQTETVGTYWHVTVVSHLDDGVHPGDWFTAHDGAGFAADGAGVVRTTPAGSGFQVGGEQLALAELQQLPTDPAALTSRITDSLDDLDRPDLSAATAVALSELLWRVPAPPAVRAAAFRALADLGNVTRLDDQDGDWVLRIEFAELPAADKFPGGVLPEGVGEWRLVIDPATSQLASLTSYQGTDEVLLAEWTDDMPPIVESPAQPDEGAEPPSVIG
jgi:hypothetical protein